MTHACLRATATSRRAGEAPAVKTFGLCPEASSLLGPCSLPETPHLDKNQPFEDTQHCQQHNHKLLVSHILFPSILLLARGVISQLVFRSSVARPSYNAGILSLIASDVPARFSIMLEVLSLEKARI